MLIGNVLEKMKAEAAWQLCADKLADTTRNIWQKNKAEGLTKWETDLSEEAAALPGMREEGFRGLVGLDYIFKWWGSDDSDGLAGEIDVIWKVISEDGDAIATYRTWIKLADRDFILGLYKDEAAKRDANRAAFRDAFAQWKKLFDKK